MEASNFLFYHSLIFWILAILLYFLFFICFLRLDHFFTTWHLKPFHTFCPLSIWAIRYLFIIHSYFFFRLDLIFHKFAVLIKIAFLILFLNSFFVQILPFWVWPVKLIYYIVQIFPMIVLFWILLNDLRWPFSYSITNIHFFLSIFFDDLFVVVFLSRRICFFYINFPLIYALTFFNFSTLTLFQEIWDNFFLFFLFRRFLLWDYWFLF